MKIQIFMSKTEECVIRPPASSFWERFQW